MKRESLEIIWERKHGDPASRSVIRVRRNHGKEEVYPSLDDAPADVRACIESFSRPSESWKQLAALPDPAAPTQSPLSHAPGFWLPWLEVEDDGKVLRLSRRWGGCIGLLAAALACVFIATGVLALLKGPPRNMPRSQLIRPVVLLPVGLALTYLSVVCFLNRTVIEVSKKRLTMRHGPVPFFQRDRNLRGAEVEELYVHMRMRKFRWYYDLYARTTAGRSVLLVRGLRNEQRAAALEQVIERRLGIE